MDQKEKDFLADTKDILAYYDGCHTVNQLKGLIDETRERLKAILNNEIDDYNNSL